MCFGVSLDHVGGDVEGRERELQNRFCIHVTFNFLHLYKLKKR